MSEVDENLIFDLGMHNGQDTDFYLKKGFRVVSVEANPELCSSCHERFATEIESGQLAIEQIAISDKVGEATFYLNQTNSKWSSIFPDWGERGKGATTITVQTVPFEYIVTTYGIPYFLKIDIEGADSKVLQALHHVSPLPPYLSAEGGEPPMLNTLKNLGYSKFAIVNQQCVPNKKCLNPAKEGKYVNHTFEMGASGLFGKELQEPWVTYAEALEERTQFEKLIAEIEKTYPNSPSQQRRARARLGWFDVHAKLK